MTRLCFRESNAAAAAVASASAAAAGALAAELLPLF